MFELLRHLSAILDSRAQRKLVLATLGSMLMALMDAVAVTLILPLVQLTTDRSTDAAAVKKLVDITGVQDLDRLTLLVTAAVVVLFVAKDIGSLVFIWWVTGFVNTERVRVSGVILEHLLRSPYTDLARRSQADLMRVTDTAVMQVFNYSINGLMYCLSSALSIGLMLVSLLFVASVPTLAILVYFGLASIAFSRLARPRARRAGQVLNDASVRGYRSAFAAFGAAKEIALRGSQEHFVRGYVDNQLVGAQAGRTASFLGTLPRYLLEILFIFGVGIVLAVSSTGDGPLGIVALFVTAGFRMLPSVSAFLSNISNIRVGADYLATVHDEVLRARATGAERHGEVEPLQITASVGLDDVTFAYPGADAPVLQAVTVTFRKGTSTAIVGRSGAGKTTLVDLLLGLHRPSAGRVLVDGVDISADPRRWRQSVGYVPQDVYILDGTLLENVAFDQRRSEIDEERARSALARADLLELLAELPQGWDTQLGERGSRLSGGQRQRVGIARALYRGPKLLVLDEATSALDSETETRVSTTIAALAGDVTVVVIAHRLSSVRAVDTVVLLEGGTIEATGSFESLRRESATFAKMVRLGTLE